MRTYISVYFASALMAMAIMPLITRIARKLRIVDRPGVRKIHSSCIPRIGGAPIVLGMLAVILPAFALDNVIGRALRDIAPQIMALLACSVLMFLVGLVDDIRGLRASVKLASQLLAAVVICAFGIRVDSISVGSLTINFGWLSWPMTILWLIGITNAVNLIDGLDGLAAGIALIACAVIAVFSFYTGQIVMSVLMLALLGSLTGFLFFNFNPAKVFMGDCGTLFVGFFLAAASVMCTAKSLTFVGLALPALALGLPIFDTFLSIVRRVLERRSIFSPDQNHIHHRLLKMGLQHRNAVVVMYMVTLAAASLGMLMMVFRQASSFLIFAAVALLLVAVFRITGAVRIRESLEKLKRNLLQARQERRERRCFETLELRMREVEGFESWWSTLCAAAGELGFFQLRLTIRQKHTTFDACSWKNPGVICNPANSVTTCFPVHGSQAGLALWIEAAVSVNGSLESAGRKTTLFERLIDEHVSAPVLCELQNSNVLRRMHPRPSARVRKSRPIYERTRRDGRTATSARSAQRTGADWPVATSPPKFEVGDRTYVAQLSGAMQGQ